jgi:hypothetical protein
MHIIPPKVSADSSNNIIRGLKYHEANNRSASQNILRTLWNVKASKCYTNSLRIFWYDTFWNGDTLHPLRTVLRAKNV